MKVIFDYCIQTRRYGNSDGQCLIELEPGDNADEIIKEYTKERPWYEQKYHHPLRISGYSWEDTMIINGKAETVTKTVMGDLILFDTSKEYVD